MARLDVYRGPDAYLLDCQANVLDFLTTRFVVPLIPADETPRAARLNPVFSIGGRPVVMSTQLASAVPVRELGPWVASLADEHDRIMNALDMLMTGY